MLSQFFQNPIYFFASAVAIILAISLHEASHALAGYLLGDRTAKDAGRLTLNPLAHLDLVGTLLLFVAGFGWGKPVPFNPYNLKNQKWGPAMIAMAGPFSNFLIAILTGFLLKAVLSFTTLAHTNGLIVLLAYLIQINIALLAFNILPVPPLDGSKLLFALLPARFDYIKEFLSRYGTWVLIAIIIFGSPIFYALFNVFNLAVNRIVGI